MRPGHRAEASAAGTMKLSPTDGNAGRHRPTWQAVLSGEDEREWMNDGWYDGTIASLRIDHI